MNIIECHITQAPYRPIDGEHLNARFVSTGSRYGRVLFTDRPPMVQIRKGINVSMENCELIGIPGSDGGTGIEIDVTGTLMGTRAI